MFFFKILSCFSVLQLGFSKITYPGITLLAGAHFNLYTAPIVLLGITSMIGICLLFCCFDGRMRVHRPPPPVYTEDIALGTVDEDTFLEEKDPEINLATPLRGEPPKYDLIAVLVLILVKLSVETVFLNLITVRK